MIKGPLYLSDYEGLIQKGLVRAKEYPDRGLVVLKYTNKVFYDNLWDESEYLLEARGHVFDMNTGRCVVRPFHKVFNIGERSNLVSNGDSLRHVGIMRKVNGFMGAITNDWEHGLIISTTGTLDSPYVKIIEKHFNGLPFLQRVLEEGITYLFEVVDKSDPHIIVEQEGLHILTSRDVRTGTYGASKLDIVKFGEEYFGPQHLPLYRKPSMKIIEVRSDEELATSPDVIRASEGSEGVMVCDVTLLDSDENGCFGAPIAKIKSKQYLFKKFLARMSKNRLDDLWDNPIVIQDRFGEEFQSVFTELSGRYTLDEFKALPEQERLTVIRQVIKGEESKMVQQSLILVRGLPGSGKSTLAQAISAEFGHNHYEADMYFVENGEYKFDYGRLKEAHGWCFQNTNNDLRHFSDVVVSNTFTTTKEIDPYLTMATDYGCELIIVDCLADYGSIHDVPDDTMTKMSRRFTHDLRIRRPHHRIRYSEDKSIEWVLDEIRKMLGAGVE